MNFELTKEFLDELKEKIGNQDEQGIKRIIEDLHPADVAKIYDELNIEEARFVHILMDSEKAAEVLVELEQDDRRRFLEVLPGDVIAKQIIDKLDSDDAADVLGELSTEKREEVLSFVEDLDQAGDIVDLLGYDEDSAGGLMAKELINVNENWNITTCIKEIRKQAGLIDEVYYVYVVDDDNKLKGTLSLKKLLVTPSTTIIKDIINTDVISVKTDTDSEEVANIMDRYDLVALPVTDSLGRLVGRITIDDVVDVIREEAGKDYQMVSGISEKVEPTDTALQITRARIPWLFIGLLGGILGAVIISFYEKDLGIYPEMAFFLPLIAAMGGNVGVQSTSIIVQSLAYGTLGVGGIGKKLLKELGVASINGLILSLVIFVYSFYTSDSFALTLTVSTALFAVLIFAAIFGTFVPLLLEKLKIDPALATGPFITTVNDIMGVFIYLVIGRAFYGIF